MTELKPWKYEGAPAEYTRLLKAARNESPSSESLQRALLAAGIVGATSLTTGSATGAAATAATSIGSAAGKGLFGLAAKVLLVSVVGGGAVMTSAIVVSQHRANLNVSSNGSSSVPGSIGHNVAEQALGQPQELVGKPPSDGIGEQPSPRDHRDSEVTLESETAQPIPRESTQVSPRVSPVGADTPRQGSARRDLLDELALVDAARTSLRSGNASQAAKSSRDILRMYPSGQFAPEALFTLMLASQQLGQVAEAQRAAREILARFPNSPQAGKAQDLLQIR